jgi:DNA-directed RNA polymerase specialized sigma24 family protein
MRKSAVVNRTDGRAAEVALVEPECISTRWTNELRRNIRVYPTCNLLKALLSLDAYTRTVLYAFLIKGWSSSRIAEHLDVSLIAIQGRLESGRERLKRKLAQAR